MVIIAGIALFMGFVWLSSNDAGPAGSIAFWSLQAVKGVLYLALILAVIAAVFVAVNLQ